MVRIDEHTNLGIALATDANGRYCQLNPYLGAQLALSEAYRNVAVSGAQPVAVTDCLNFGSPEDPEVMWQFVEAIKGLVDGCLALGTPVTGGNVSFYNQTGGRNILPTPQVGMLGVIDDVRTRIPMGFSRPGDVVLLLGETKEELGGSAWSEVIHAHLGGLPPYPNLDGEQALASVMIAAAARGLVAGAHDLSEGGLAIALTESCLRHGNGVSVTLPEGLDATTMLFSETPARALVCVQARKLDEFVALCEQQRLPVARIGEVVRKPELEVVGQFSLPLSKIREAWRAPIPTAMG
jgi:phosphoribosylformylglycinamidine synthase